MKLIAMLAMLYVGACALLFAFQRSFLFAADKTVAEPQTLGLPETEVVDLTTSDGIKISCWLSRQPASHRIAIYFHGNGGSLAWRAPSILRLQQLGFSVLAVEYRGYGGSGGTPSESGLARDADAAYGYARTLGYKPSQIVLYGESLGSGVALSLATRREVAGLILDSPSTSVSDVAASRFWMFPARWMVRDPFRSDLLIGAIKVPVLILHGTADRVVPIRFGRALFARAGANVEFVEIAGADHVVLNDKQAQAPLKAWIERLPAAALHDAARIDSENRLPLQHR